MKEPLETIRRQIVDQRQSCPLDEWTTNWPTCVAKRNHTKPFTEKRLLGIAITGVVETQKFKSITTVYTGSADCNAFKPVYTIYQYCNPYAEAQNNPCSTGLRAYR
ncbi:hypothetical protein NPIL_220771 [Nephila pilipes]|uniref:Uncharacterized protein n=1 Tax=Nephila pilipes TaxID=299642 RepID=A0A8X6NJ55_NEPPI|nr:hypothetical protein NPIL_220771 [Nephila pilipes]